MSVRNGSFFSKSKLSSKIILKLLYMLINRCKTSMIIHETGISNKTLVDFRMFYRELCTAIIRDGCRIGGGDSIIEIDETCFGYTKYGKGATKTQTWVFGGLERGGMGFAEIVGDRSKKTLLKVIKRKIEPGSTIYSDEWASYKKLATEGFRHLAVNHSKVSKGKLCFFFFAIVI
uniref:ISXO2-like transposase domain-containing protein n=1 Tax=Panagrolaimus superbus TaxID=310955 RepID=A0A914YNC8_9BILA